ncbi:hypothetical protein KO494_03620 [Lacinutrix sp. C3R15]|uniref:hypothetical protein n=1 Tax=Flavobacteriaceae TaxID=49546 RepID=UPI001C09086C|nr:MULTISPECIES: hypothetical protein [Flavobacteriaceae]MBU2938622.1 hypothetical protein [Lacinutrix sp. C3R15]MDO6621936.1 hypothetical protein [Oceanihabitans sp. 1_MG-2023]
MNKKQIINTLKLLGFIIVVSFIIDKIAYFTITKISDTVYSGQAIGKLNHYLAIKDTTKLIVFGSSRANHHIDVKKLNPSSYNMGVDGKFIAYSATLIKLLPKDVKQTVILHVDPNVAYREYYNREETKTLMVKYHTNAVIKEELDRAELTNPLQNFYWCIDYNGLVLGILKNAVFPKYDLEHYYGYDPMEVHSTQKEIFKKILERNDSIVCKTNLKLNPLFNTYLKEIESFCSNNNKKLITITTPLYIDKCPEDNNALRKILEDLNIEYHDYSNFFENKNSTDYWVDIAHMSNVGAEIFSEAIRKDLSIND